MDDERRQFGIEADSGDSYDSNNPFDDYDQYSSEFNTPATTNDEEEYGYASAPKGGSARDRIEEQRRMRTGTQRLSSQDRGQQRVFYTIGTVVSLLIITGVIAFLLFRDTTSNSNNNTSTAPVVAQATATTVASTANTTRTPLPLGVSTTVVITDATGNGGNPTPVDNTVPSANPTVNDTTVNVDATAKPVEPTPPPAESTAVAPVEPTAPPQPSGNPASVRKYTIVDGDTFEGIAAQFGVNTGQLLAANNDTVKHPSQFAAGSEINIPAPDYSPPSVQWQVQPGEYLNQIIRELQATDTNVDKIAAANPCGPGVGVCQPDYQLFPYDVLTIPFH